MAITIHHIGIANRDPSRSLMFFREILGLPIENQEEIPEQGVRVTVVGLPGTRLEVLEPTTQDSPVARFLEKRGDGLHHLALGVPDIRAMVHRLKGFGLQPIGDGIKQGEGGNWIAFYLPKDTGGILLELVQDAPQHDAPGGAST